jgi:hypothetical protein
MYNTPGAEKKESDSPNDNQNNSHDIEKISHLINLK